MGGSSGLGWLFRGDPEEEREGSSVASEESSAPSALRVPRDEKVPQREAVVLKPVIYPFVGRRIAFLIIVVVAYAWVSVSLPGFVAWLLSYVFLVLGAVAGFGVVWGFLNKNALVYTLTDDELTIRRTLITNTSREVPLESISDLYVDQSMFGRWLHYGNVQLVSRGGSTAGGLIAVPDPQFVASQVIECVRFAEREMNLPPGAPVPHKSPAQNPTRPQ